MRGEISSVPPGKLAPPRTWQEPTTHLRSAVGSPWFELQLDLVDCLNRGTADFWSTRGVKCAYLPLTTGSISSPMGRGSDSTPVSVTLNGVETYLADSQQFALEFGCRLCPNGCYYVMPSFRGEANDERHLGQFFHSEAELPGTLEDIMHTVEDYLRHLAGFYLDEVGTELTRTTGSVTHIEDLATGVTKSRAIDFDDAFEQLKEIPGATTCHTDPKFRTITSIGERRLMMTHGEFTWLVHHDEMSVPFYQATGSRPDGTLYALNGDLLFGIGETVGAGQRHATAPEVVSSLRRHDVSEADYQWYCELREVAPMQTAGFGMGVERFHLWLLKHTDIRDLQLLLRENGRLLAP